MPEDAQKKSRKRRGSIVRYAIPVVFMGIVLAIVYQFVPESIDLDTAIDEAYEIAEIDLVRLRSGKDNSFLCFENPRSRDELFECDMNGPMLSLNIKGTFLKCQASRPSYTQFLGSTWVTMNCQAEDGPSHGLPRYYELKSLTDIPQGDFGMGGLFSSADENGNYLHPVLFGIEPIEEIVPMD